MNTPAGPPTGHAPSSAKLRFGSCKGIEAARCNVHSLACPSAGLIRCAASMLPTLTFCSAGLEAAYLSHAAPTRARTAARFACFRFVLLLFTAARALLTVRRWGPEALLLLGAASNWLPLWAAVNSPTSRFAWLAHWGTLATEVLQATIGVINHRHMAPSHVGGQPAAAVVYLFYGSTALWMHGYSAFSMLPFHLLLAQQSLVAMVLLAGSGSMCRDSAGLRTGYGALHSLLRRAAHAVYTWHLPLLSRWPAAVWALGLEPSSPTCTANSAAGPTPAARADQPSAVAASGAANAQADALARLCISYQLPILLLVGFGLSTWLAYRAERSSRVAWLTHLQQSGGSGAASAAADDGSRGSGGSPRAGANPDAADLALQRAAETELIGPLPNDADYWLQLALPCMLCIGAVAHTIV